MKGALPLIATAVALLAACAPTARGGLAAPRQCRPDAAAKRVTLAIDATGTVVSAVCG